MGALPKRKTSKSRTLKRRSVDKISLPQLVVENVSKTKTLPHRASSAGIYKGKKVFKVK
ncbi:50S ribosomal protein L32 [bacterium]|nr:MAG: 50S ribosomal protein L32 [bacterium]